MHIEKANENTFVVEKKITQKVTKSKNSHNFQNLRLKILLVRSLINSIFIHMLKKLTFMTKATVGFFT